ncbi:MAG: DUF4445 domain-containing protein [Deltaproteobacteria bacterium]|nr:DUF4445 domain-containing protein [Deltaproteobacteria bacterium]
MDTCKVHFLPDGKEVDVASGSTIMEAAEKAGVFINSLCGGNGVCGKCRVQIRGGKVKADTSAISFLSREEVAEGFVLACQAKVDGDLEVVIPPESRLESEQILMDQSTINYSDPEKIFVARVPADPVTFFEPLVKKIFLDIKAPSPEDNISDLDRIIRDLRHATGYQSFDTSLRCLQGLAAMLRDNDWKVTATIAKCGELRRILQIEGGDTSDQNYGIAIDVGTTTVVAQLVHLRSGNVIGVAGSHNLQARYGEDVISRMIFACNREDGLNPLHKAIIKNINNLVKKLTEKNGIGAEQINSVVAAGNTTMSHLLLSLIPCSIRLDPYVPTAKIFPQTGAAELRVEINPAGIIETIPSVTSYVGGDIVAGVIACGIADKPEIKVLIDVGTNGEIVIGNNEWMVCCSASAGPAFEGGGIRNGMRATRGAIESIKIDGSDVHYQTIGNARPSGICGSGLIDCIYEMIRNGIIDPYGKFNLSAGNERLIEKEDEIQFKVVPSQETETGEDLTINEADIGNIIRSKGAIFAAIKSLMDYVDLKFDAVDTFFVAGGFGNYLNIEHAIGIGLLPDIALEKIQFVGNSSLMGARVALLSGNALDRTKKIARGITNIELSTYQPFMDEYVAAMFLPHTDRKLFPSVDY